MRRFASVFSASSRRGDKSDPPHDDSRPRLGQKKSRVFHSLSRKHLSSQDPPSLPLVATDLANSSSSSSSGSTTLRTPDDDILPRIPSKKGSWRSWLGGKNGPVADHPGEPTSPWKTHTVVRTPSNGADATSEQSHDPYGDPDDALSPTLSPRQRAAARSNAHVMIMNSLVHDSTLPPLLESQGVSFPRSCHNFRRLRRRETLESELHKKSLLARLDRLSPAAELSIAPFAFKLITPKPHPHNFQDDVFPSTGSINLHSTGLENWVSRPCFEDRFHLWACSDSGEIYCTQIPGSHFGVAALEFSESLELLAGTLLEGGEEMQASISSGPDLEFSLPSLTLDLDSPAAQLKEPDLAPLSLQSGMTRFKDSSAELSSPPEEVDLSPGAGAGEPPRAQQVDPSVASSGSAQGNDHVPKRGVRFADDDGKDDQIPLGHVLRIRKNKEQKARFLREERARRERAAQVSLVDRRATAPPPANSPQRAVPPRHIPAKPLVSLHEPSKPPQQTTVSRVLREEDRLRREVEKVEMEKLRRSRELARQQAEEREHTYVEELQATRARREASRAGRPLEFASLSPGAPDRARSGYRDSILVPPQALHNYAEELQATRARREASRAGRPLESASLSPGVSSRARSGSRDSMPVSPQGSHKHTPELVFSPVSPFEGSPSSSVPATPGSQYSLSRPPSVYSAHTASSEDARGRDGKRVSRRMSAIPDPAKSMSLHPPYDPRLSFNPYGWTNVPLVPAMSPVPQMPAMLGVNGLPFYGVDMPLLPPTAPFMMNQYGVRSRSFTGSIGQQSPLQSSTSLPKNYSSEGVNSSSRASSPHSSGSHQRRSSDEAWAAKTRRDSRSASSNDVRASATTGSMRVSPSQSNMQRASWLLPEQNMPRKTSLRPTSNAYPTSPSAYARRRTTAS